MIIEYCYSHTSSPLYLITRSATVAAMAESVSTWSMRTSKTDSVGRVQHRAMDIIFVDTSWETISRNDVTKNTSINDV